MAKVAEIKRLDQLESELAAEGRHLERAREELQEAEAALPAAQEGYDAAAHRHFRREISAEEEAQERSKFLEAQARANRLRPIIERQRRSYEEKQQEVAAARRAAIPAIVAAGQAEVEPLLDAIIVCYEQITAFREKIAQISARVRQECRSLGDHGVELNANVVPRIEAWNRRTGKTLFTQ